ncbi:MAG: Wzz/FepE/Etk N-terminal domain-containing protein [Pseudomonadota bacterium]
MQESLVSNVDAGPRDHGDDEFHLVDHLVTLAQYKKWLIGLPLLFGALGLTLALVMAPKFSSTAVVMPPKQQQSGVAAMLGQLGGLAGAAGGLGGMKNGNELYVGMLSSRTVADQLITRFKLKERYHRQTMDDARKALDRVTEIAVGKKDGLIVISVTDKDPEFAATLANGYTEELMKLTQTLAITEAQQRRAFFEKQLLETKDQLANAEVGLRETQERTGMLMPDTQVGAIITTAAQLKGAIAAKEVQLSAMRTFATGRNPDLLLLQQEIQGMKVQLSKLERNQGGKSGDFMVATDKIPQVGVEYVRSLRNVKYYEAMFEMLAKQFELAKIDEAKDVSSIQVLDKAVPAEREANPRLLKLPAAGLFGGLILAVLIAFAHTNYRRLRTDPGNTVRLQHLALTWKRGRQA